MKKSFFILVFIPLFNIQCNYMVMLTSNNSQKGINNKKILKKKKSLFKIGSTLFLLNAIKYFPLQIKAQNFIKKVTTNNFNIKGRVLSLASNALIAGGDTGVNGVISRFDLNGNILKSEIFPGVYRVSTIEERAYEDILFGGTSDVLNSTFNNMYAGIINTTSLTSKKCFQFGGDLNDESVYITQIISNNKIFLGGNTNSFGAGETDPIFLSFNDTTLSYAFTYGTTDNDIIADGAKTDTNKIILIGTTGTKKKSIFFFIIDPTDGNLEESISLIGDTNTLGNKIISTQDGGIAYCGVKIGDNAKKIALIGKLNSNLDIQWITKVFSNKNIDITCESITEKTIGGFVFTGNVVDSINQNNFDNVLIGTIESDGNFINAYTFGDISKDCVFSIVQTPTDGNIVVFGFTSGFRSSQFGFLLAKTNENGMSECTSLLDLNSDFVTNEFTINTLTTNQNNVLNSLLIPVITNCGDIDLSTTTTHINCDPLTQNNSNDDDDDSVAHEWWFWVAIFGGILLLIAIIVCLYFCIKACIKKMKERRGERVDSDEEVYDSDSYDRRKGRRNKTYKNTAASGETNKEQYDSDSILNEGHIVKLNEI